MPHAQGTVVQLPVAEDAAAGIGLGTSVTVIGAVGDGGVISWAGVPLGCSRAVPQRILALESA